MRGGSSPAPRGCRTVISSARSGSSLRPLRSSSRSVVPSTYSITMYGTASPPSASRDVLAGVVDGDDRSGGSARRRDWASRRNRAWNDGSRARSGRRVLTATCGRGGGRARSYTSAMPPRPSTCPARSARRGGVAIVPAHGVLAQRSGQFMPDGLRAAIASCCVLVDGRRHRAPPRITSRGDRAPQARPPADVVACRRAVLDDDGDGDLRARPPGANETNQAYGACRWCRLRGAGLARRP